MLAQSTYDAAQLIMRRSFSGTGTMICVALVCGIVCSVSRLRAAAASELLVKPCPTQVNPWSNPGQTLVRPRSDPGQTSVKLTAFGIAPLNSSMRILSIVSPDG